MKTVYLDTAWVRHSYHDTLFSHPPSGYQFNTRSQISERSSRLVWSYGRNLPFIRNVLLDMIPVNLCKSFLERYKKIDDGIDLTYCASRVSFRKEPWVVDFEAVSQLTGSSFRLFQRYKKAIERLLKSGYCKKNPVTY